MEVSGLHREHVRPLWDKLKPFFETFVESSEGEEALGDMVHSVMEGRRQVWVVVDKEILACALTEVRRNGAVVILYVAGRNRHAWRDELVETLSEWAKEHGDRLRVPARVGWEPELKRLGFKRRRVVMDRMLT